jgi:hypothetical protein
MLDTTGVLPESFNLVRKSPRSLVTFFIASPMELCPPSEVKVAIDWFVHTRLSLIIVLFRIGDSFRSISPVYHSELNLTTLKKKDEKVIP